MEKCINESQYASMSRALWLNFRRLNHLVSIISTNIQGFDLFLLSHDIFLDSVISLHTFCLDLGKPHAGHAAMDK